ncbi:MAG: hypothetical protein J6C75_00030, partial [Oscillospiraceae bacterium]|nr:hypothetical protein [Oscillospiraceae bacterium]
MNEFISAYGLPIIGSIITAVLGWVGLQIKALYERYVDTKEKQAVCRTVVAAVDQIYKDLGGEEKLDKAIEAASDMLNARGITCTELELRMLLESAVYALKGG